MHHLNLFSVNDLSSVHIVDYLDKEKRFEFHLDAVQKIFNQPEIANKPIALYSICGKRRSGKSFLLNLFLRHLEVGQVSTGSSFF